MDNSKLSGMNSVALCTLGVCSVEIRGGMASTIPSNLFRVATYILLSGNNVTISRQRLAALFWPDADHVQAGVNLRQTLVRIRRFQDAHHFRLLESNFTLVRLDPYGVDWDLQELVQALSVDCERDLQELVQALSVDCEAAIADVCRLYSGDLLADIPESGEEFESWLSEQRVLLRESVIGKLMEALDGPLRISMQVRSHCARKLLSIDPGNETAFQFLMKEAAEHGDYARLRQIYAKCERCLMNEFGVSSSHQTRSLYMQLLSDQSTLELPEW